ncbi:hypothetical protein JW979_14720 [bacterium]|nr:hypothetical protein [candidate division CSSED10-310 bacterium]
MNQQYNIQSQWQARKEYPLFSKIIFSIDIGLSSLRLPLAFLSIIGYMAMEANDPIRGTAVFEIITGFLIFAAGLTANILCLLRKYIGITLGYINVGVTILSMIVGIWQITIMHDAVRPGSAESFGFLIGVIASITIRLGILGLYIAALILFKKFMDSQKSTLPQAMQYH